MSKYTTELRYICESYSGLDESGDYSSVDDVIENSREKIFDFDFPMFDEEYRSVLETKIIRHYYTREIGLETVGLWKLKLQTKLNEIMPYYNKLYDSELLKYDPLRDVDMTTTNVGQKTGERTDITNSQDSNERKASNIIDDSRVQNDERTNRFDGSRSTESEDTSISSANTQGGNTNTNYNVYSDTPQGSLTGVENGNYLTNARKVTDAGTTSSATDSSDVNKGNIKTEDENTEITNGTNLSIGKREEAVTGNDKRNTSSLSTGKTNNTEDYVMHVFGKSAGASYAKMLKEFRDNLLNIDMLIIRDLAELFMLIW